MRGVGGSCADSELWSQQPVWLSIPAEPARTTDMSGDEMIFDPIMSKKKKKKKPFMLDEEGDAQTEETQPSETKEVEPEPTEEKDVEADEEDSRKKGE